MSCLSDRFADVSPSLLAAVLLVARVLYAQLRLPHPSVAQILEATGSSRSRAYELRDRLEAALPTLVGPVGRPAAPVEARPDEDATAALSRTTLRFVMDHPGCVHRGPGRRRYADVFRHFVLELREHHPEIELERFAEAVEVPRPTLEDWLRAGDRPEVDEDEPAESTPLLDEATDARIQTVLFEWSKWRGDFTTFCDHVRQHCRLPWAKTSIAEILELHGARTRRRRPGRSSDEEALRGSFETFFPGAQWVGDGTEIDVTINGDSFTFNVEIDVDTFSAAVVGASVRDTEDSAAVVEALRDGIVTTGEPPLALLLDNKPCNHTDDVVEALGDTLRIRATTGRAQNKAHVEGTFGLFSQEAPPLTVQADSARELARQMLALTLTTWARACGHRPRKDRGGKSRVQLYRENVPCPEQIEAARQQLDERLRRQERARQTRIARADPTLKQTLDDAFQRLGLQDPEGHFRSVLAGYGPDIVVDAIAIFDGKNNHGTLPDGADARYLLGIVKNLHHNREAELITESLIRWRTKVRDLALRALEQERDDLLASGDCRTVLHALVDRALATDRNLDHHFWLDAAADLIKQHPAAHHEDLFRSAARRIHATFRVDQRTRSATKRTLARQLWPLS